MNNRSAPIALSRGDLESALRVHVNEPQGWGYKVGTDFWIIATANGEITATNAHELADYGWTTTSLSMADGSGADFMTRDDVGTPGEFTQNAQSDLIKSPAIFGDYAHAHAAAAIMGKRSLPRYLVCDIYARFSVASADDATGNIGLVEDGGSIVVSADAAAVFNSDGTNFRFNVNGTRATNVANVAIVTTPTWFRIVMDKYQALAIGSINGVKVASATITNDEFPVAFGAGSGGATNLIQLNQAHVFYAWSLPPDILF